MVLLGTAIVHVRDHAGVIHPIRALIDSASQVSTITGSCVERLGFRISKWTVPLTGLSGVQVPNVTGAVECTVFPRHSVDHSVSIKAWVLPKITGDMPLTPLPPKFKDNFTHLALADPSFDIPGPIDLLLGADVFAQVLDGKRIILDKSLPAAFGSLFGWVIIGPIAASFSDLHSHLVSLTVSLEDMIQRFWTLEEPGTAPTSFTDDGRCEHIYSTERVRDINGRFLVPLPFRSEPPPTFSESKQIALKRFQNLEKKLEADEALGQAYRDFMLEYERLGHMSVTSNPGAYFIPHHSVFKGSSSSGKIRVVFDASAKSGSNGSLNQCLHIGPKLQQDIVDILLRFRVYKYAFTTDVCKMYRQILVLPHFRKYQHILWRPSPLDQLMEYELKTVTYGVNCAPFLALRVLQDIAEQECINLPGVRNALQHQTYVDDICCGADSVPELLKLQSDLKDVLDRAGFELKKWSSNSSEVLLAVKLEDRATNDVSFDDSEVGIVEVLGLQWQSNQDIMFGFHVQPSSKAVTKRSVLSTIAQIFDPLGFIAPVIFYAKHIMQLLWKAELAWDDPLPVDLSDKWISFMDDLPALSSVLIPRHMSISDRAHIQLCGFCDASDKGYAAVVYLRVRSADDTISISLLGSKTKMAPMKTSTTPRLELCAALLLARWMSRIQEALQESVAVDETFAWSDSQVALSWIVKPHISFKVFVSNRVHQIQEFLPQCSWRYVRSTSNPADCASRGLLPSELLQHSLYWDGPDFLKYSEDTWESALSHLLPDEQLSELKLVSLATHIDYELEWFLRFSSYTNMIKVISWVRRFIGRCRGQIYNSSFLSRSELNDTLTIIVRTSQRCSLNNLYEDLIHQRTPSRAYAGLRPFIDSNGLLRVGGRLRHGDLSSSQRQPILLTKGSHLSLLIVRHWHLVTCHSGPRVITALISRQFWIMSVRVVIRKVIGCCNKCVRAIARTPNPVMADLPAARVQACRPFGRVGIDYAGPLPMRECRLRKPRVYKAYIAIFVCMSMKAVHLEVVMDLSTDAFLAAFDRFVSRRGLPQDIYSDCGTNFVGASKQLRNLVNHPDNQHIISSHSVCSWHFNPPSAPHFGGLWEAAVRSTKRLLVRVMGCHKPTLEELTTVLCRIEAVLNSRPLTPMSSSPLDLDYLTPGHFLIGQPILAVPDLPIPEGERKLTARWKLLHHCHQAFWRRWSSEYLSSLQNRNKWTIDTPNLHVGNMVVIKDNIGPPTSWRIGRVIEVVPGDDGVVRVAKVLTSTGEITRPIVKLVLLPTD